MNHTIVITEKTSIADRISQILSGSKYLQKGNKNNFALYEFEQDDVQYHVIAVQGHCIRLDLPENLRRWTMDSVKRIGETDPIYFAGDDKTIEWMHRIINGADDVIIATDFDREGELIAGEILEYIGVSFDDPRVRRIRFSTVVKDEILEAFKNPFKLDRKIVNAGQTRQVIDLMFGAGFTRMYTLLGHGSMISVGRVQTPTLIEMWHRELEIKNFVPEKYWTLQISLDDKQGAKIFRYVKNPIKEQTEKEKLEASLSLKSKVKILESRSKNMKIAGETPMNTSDALILLTNSGMTAEDAMKNLEHLYSKGIISYPRTDNQVFDSKINLREILHELSRSPTYQMYIQELLKLPKIIARKGKKKTVDHPPIYPLRIPESFETPNAKKTFDLLLRKFLSVLSPDAEIERTIETIEIQHFRFQRTINRVIHPSWFSLEHPSFRLDDPPIDVNSEITIKKILLEEKQTSPPPMYTNASILRYMEKNNIGTKATRHTIIRTLRLRNYIDPRTMHLTNIGTRMCPIFERFTKKMTSPEMTAHLEEEMNNIENGKQTKENILFEFKKIYSLILEEVMKNKQPLEETLRILFYEASYVGPCSKCQNGSLIVRGSRDRKFIGCSAYPVCTELISMPSSSLMEITSKKCSECGFPIGIFVLPRISQRVSMCLRGDCPSFHRKHQTKQKCSECQGELKIRIFPTQTKLFCEGCRKYSYLKNSREIFEIFQLQE